MNLQDKSPADSPLAQLAEEEPFSSICVPAMVTAP